MEPRGILQAISRPGWGLSAGVHQGLSALGLDGMGESSDLLDASSREDSGAV